MCDFMYVTEEEVSKDVPGSESSVYFLYGNGTHKKVLQCITWYILVLCKNIFINCQGVPSTATSYDYNDTCNYH